jgi:hypothetical protein
VVAAVGFEAFATCVVEALAEDGEALGCASMLAAVVVVGLSLPFVDVVVLVVLAAVVEVAPADVVVVVALLAEVFCVVDVAFELVPGAAAALLLEVLVVVLVALLVTCVAELTVLLLVVVVAAVVAAGLEVAAEAAAGEAGAGNAAAEEALEAAGAEVAEVLAAVDALVFFASLLEDFGGVAAGGCVADFAALVACEAALACCSAGLGGAFGTGLAAGAPPLLVSVAPELRAWLDGLLEDDEVEAFDDDVLDDVEDDFAAVEDEEEVDAAAFDDAEDVDEEEEGEDEPDFALDCDAGADSVGDADIALDINAVGAKTTRIATSVARSVYVRCRALLWFQCVWSRARISPPSTAPKRC